MLNYQTTCRHLGQVHQNLYKVFRWTEDAVVWDVPEHWGLPVERDKFLLDDCDGFAFAVLRDWQAEGFPVESMYPVVCAVQRLPYDHACAAIETDRGLLISECNSPRVMLISALPYRHWHRPGDGGRAPINQPWEKI